MVSRIIGTALLRCLGAQRVADLAQARAVFGRTIDRAAPVERLVLREPLAEPPCNLGSRQFGPEIERVRAVMADVELGKKGKRVLRDVMSVPVVDVDPVLGDLDAEIVVPHLRGQLGNLARSIGKRLSFVQRKKSGAVILRYAAVLTCREH